MKKHLLSFAALAAMAIPASAAATGGYNGYFRVQSGDGVAAQKGYVQVTGMFTARPDQTFADARTQAGTVMYLDAEPVEKNGKTVYRVNSLRSQGIEIVGTPVDNYYETLMGIVDSESNGNDIIYAMARYGRQNGYVSLMRATLESLIYIVAGRLDSEGQPTAGQESLADFADRFNKEVADKIDLNFYLEPAGSGMYLYYDMPNLNAVSEWYLKPENKEVFERGFANMRHYLLNKMGVTGEGFDPTEIKMMKDWGYDITAKYGADANSEGVIVSSYEKIFADPDLLYNWLKMNVIKFMDPEMCPKISLMGFYLPDFAAEMQRHGLTKQLISYLPRLHTDTRYYLISGTVTDASGVEGTAGTQYNATGTFGFANAQGVHIAGAAAEWVFTAMNGDDNIFGIKPQAFDEQDNKWYSSNLFDFPVKAASADMTIYAITQEAPENIQFADGKELNYVTLEPTTTVAANEPMLIITGSDAFDDCRLLVDYTTTVPAEKPSGFIVGEEVVDKQYTVRRAAEDENPGLFKGVLLDTRLDSETMHRMWGIEYDADKAPVYTLATNTDAPAKTVVFKKNTDTARANEAFMFTTVDQPHNIVAVAMPDETPTVNEVPSDVTTGIDAIDAEKTGDNRFYDLNGRVVTNPEAGNIYIYNGKKILVY